MEGFIVSKPILCGPADVFLEGIERTSQEKPIGFWIDSQYGNKVMLLRNADTGSVSVLEFMKTNPELLVFSLLVNNHRWCLLCLRKRVKQLITKRYLTNPYRCVINRIQFDDTN